MKLSHYSLSLMILLIPHLACAHDATPPDGLVGGTFTVTDARAHDEISEVSHLYINDHLAATFRLDLTHPVAQTSVVLPIGSENVSYSLCGTITIAQNGHTETHTVSSDGVLHHPDGHHYEAVGSENFTDFFLVDDDETDSSADHKTGNSHLCMTPNA